MKKRLSESLKAVLRDCMTLNNKFFLHIQDICKNSSRKSVILKRWFDLIILSIVSFLICVVVSIFIEPYFSKLSATVEKIPIWIQSAICILLFTLLWLPCVPYGSFSVKSPLSSTFRYYPPFWLACIITIILLQSYIPIVSGGQITPVLLIIMFCAFGVVIAVLYSKWILSHSSSYDRRQENHKAEATKPITEDFNALLQWIEEEKPIETSEQDKLDNKIFAERIVNVICPAKGKINTITLIGSYGAGKSSILNMVKSDLRKSGANNPWKHSLILVDVCGWGLQKGSAAETILKQVITGCAQHVDCLGLSNLPARYSASIGHAPPSWTKALFGLLSPSYDPMETLERMDTVLLAIDKRVVIFFEDLDRNWQGNDFWVEIISLLDRLKQLDRVSFVLAITETDEIGDIINRISDHIEIVPKLSVGHFKKVYDIFRSECIQEYATDIPFAGKEDQYHKLLVSQRGELDAITALIENPRNLKHALRRTHSAWENIHGEIDFDHLFIANVFRIVVPGVFNFIHENLSDIHMLGQKSRKEEKVTQEKEQLRDKLSKTIAGSPSRLENVEKLLHFLLTYWLPASRGGYGVIQGFSSAKPTDYWNRMIREKRDEGEISDQEVARAISKWKEDKDIYVYKNLSLASAVIEVPGFLKKIKQFSELLDDGHHIRILLSQLFELVCHTNESSYPYFSESEWEVFRNLVREKPFTNHAQWLIDEVSKLLSVNLSTATYVLIHFTEFVNETEGQRVRNALLENAKSIYSDKEIFLHAINFPSNSIDEFIKIVNGFHNNPDDIESISNRWRWLADLLLDTVKTHGSIIIPQILEFSVFKPVPLADSSWILNSEYIETMFQERQRDFMLFLSEIDTSHLVEELRLKAAADGELAEKDIETMFQERQRDFKLLLPEMYTSQLVEQLRLKAEDARKLASEWLLNSTTDVDDSSAYAGWI